jgi:hypothetical protein
MKQECGNCLYFQNVIAEDEIGICRFDPPKPIVVVADIVEHLQPQTAVHNWCGRHMIRASDAKVEKE